jgi:hypothetical protein
VAQAKRVKAAQIAEETKKRARAKLEARKGWAGASAEGEGEEEAEEEAHHKSHHSWMHQHQQLNMDYRDHLGNTCLHVRPPLTAHNIAALH